MFRNRIFCLVTALCCLLGLAATAAAAEVDSGAVYCFSAEDFSSETPIAGICITEIPEEGALLLGSRSLRPGDVLTAEQVARMTFSASRSEDDAVAVVGYLPVFEDHVEGSASMTLSIRGREDKAPAAEDFAVETYKNLPNTGKLKATDPEGQPMTFTVVRPPRRGTLEISEDGPFTYTPKKNKVGIDSFIYTATDYAGKTSREATVTVTILKPTDAAQYTDTVGRDCRFAAEWMRHTGIFAGESLAQSRCFSPDKEVTRGEFVAMLVKSLDIPTDEELVYTGYTDDIPQWLRPYVAAAVRSGLTAGLEEQQVFGAEEPITGTEVLQLLRNALDTDTAETFSQLSDTPITRGDAAQTLYQAVKLAEEQKIDTIV